MQHVNQGVGTPEHSLNPQHLGLFVFRRSNLFSVVTVSAAQGQVNSSGNPCVSQQG